MADLDCRVPVKDPLRPETIKPAAFLVQIEAVSAKVLKEAKLVGARTAVCPSDVGEQALDVDPRVVNTRPLIGPHEGFAKSLQLSCARSKGCAALTPVHIRSLYKTGGPKLYSRCAFTCRITKLGMRRGGAAVDQLLGENVRSLGPERTLVEHLRRSHVPATTRSQLAHPVTRGPLSAKR